MCMYHEGNRELQDLFGTRPLADRMEDATVTDSQSEGDQAFIEARDRSFLVTPVPEWKKGDWVADVLPDNDPVRDPSRPVA